ncbi:MAG: metalloregulator ArsR/SmtB family transcription factor [Bacteroidales bacterium]|nr:metalloregulator ArsR/SmtB family transcription factor [Bacteroidales bacterium]
MDCNKEKARIANPRQRRDLKKLQLIFQTLSDYNRLGMIQFIGEKERSVGEIVKETKLSQPLVSHHLRVLKNNGILETKRNGPFIFYYIRDKKILDAIDLFSEIFKDSDIKDKTGSGLCSNWISSNFNKTI